MWPEWGARRAAITVRGGEPVPPSPARVEFPGRTIECRRMSQDLPQDEVTRLIQEASSSEGGASDALLGLVYDQLRKIAQQRMNQERREHTLQATALVHEAYLRLVGDTETSWQGRAHFFAAAAEAMRRILIDH